MTPLPLSARASSASLVASIAMLIHAVLGMFGIAAWLRTPNVVSWRLLLTLLVTLAGVSLSASLWIAPSRKAAIAGLVVLAVSLARVGMPNEWGVVSTVMVALTVLFCVPLVRALVALD